MEKIKLKFQTPRPVRVNYGTTWFEITPFLGFSLQVALTEKYLHDLFNPQAAPLVEESKLAYFEAESNLRNYILQALTDLDTENLDADFYVDVAFWEVISRAISNYGEFRYTLQTIVNEALKQRELELSLPNQIQLLIEKAEAALNKFADMNPEQLEKMRTTGLELMERLEKSSVLGGKQPRKTHKPKQEQETK